MNHEELTAALDALEDQVSDRTLFASVIVTDGKGVGIRLCIPPWSLMQAANTDRTPDAEADEGKTYAVQNPSNADDGVERASRTLEALYALRRAHTDHAHGIALLIHELRSSLEKMGFETKLQKTGDAGLQFTTIPDRASN